MTGGQMIVDPKSGEIKDLGFNPADYPELDEIYQLYDQDMAKAAYADKVCDPVAEREHFLPIPRLDLGSLLKLPTYRQTISPEYFLHQRTGTTATCEF